MNEYMQMAEAGMAAVSAGLGESWVDEFSLEDFSLVDPWKCVLGQAYRTDPGIPGYSLGLDALTPAHADRYVFARRHGFCAGRASEYGELERAWRELISAQKARRGQADHDSQLL